MGKGLFAVLKIAYLHEPNNVWVKILTDSPCHLFCYDTPNKPRKHPKARTIRGLLVPWGVYFCFTGYKASEQIEDGDTYTHRFSIFEWPIPQTRYFLFAGTVGGIESPSCSPIFQHKNSGFVPHYWVRRPNATGFYQLIPNGTPAPFPFHYLDVNEETPDEDVSNVNSLMPGVTQSYQDTYAIQSISPATNPIEGITHTIRVRQVINTAPLSIVSRVFTLYGRRYAWGSIFNVPSTYQTYSWTFHTNPLTGQAWTNQEAHDIQPGVVLATMPKPAGQAYALCTQVYTTIWFDFEWEK